MRSKKCPVCKESIKKKYSFCPNCGTQLKDNVGNWGMLGKNDLLENEKPGIIEGFGDKILDKALSKIVNQGFKMIGEMNKEVSKNFQNQGGIPFGNITIKRINPNGSPKEGERKDPNVKFLPIEFTEENLEKWKKVKKKEPRSNLKRVEDKIEYEVEIPGVKSIKDISILKLENSLEIRAISEKTGYLKRIAINLPLKKYSLVKGTLTLELDTLN